MIGVTLFPKTPQCIVRLKSSQSVSPVEIVVGNSVIASIVNRVDVCPLKNTSSRQLLIVKCSRHVRFFKLNGNDVKLSQFFMDKLLRELKFSILCGIQVPWQSQISKNSRALRFWKPCWEEGSSSYRRIFNDLRALRFPSSDGRKQSPGQAIISKEERRGIFIFETQKILLYFTFFPYPLFLS